MKEKEQIDKLYYEKIQLEKGCKYIAGIDEVGRGPLAGPVVCGCVIMPLNEEDIIDGVDDSKKVSEKKRIILNDKIIEKAVAYSICRIEPSEIDEINILNAVKKCMTECVKTLSVRPDVVFIDAVKLDLDIPTVSIIKGDYLSYTIGAASIIAKVFRDRLMEEYDKFYPEYNFQKNKGYGTAEHIAALEEYGPCKIHRTTFIKNFTGAKASEQLRLI